MKRKHNVNATTKAIADEATKTCLSKMQSTTTHKENVRTCLRPIVESITNKTLVVICEAGAAPLPCTTP